MGLPFSYVTYVLLLSIILLLFRYYWYAKKRIQGFPFISVVPIIIYNLLTGKRPEDVPITSYLFHRLLDILQEHSKDGIVMTYITRPILFIFSEHAVKFFSNEKAAVNKSPEYILVGESLGNGIATSNGERWRIHRKIMNPAFHMTMLKEKVPIFNEHAIALVRDMEQLVGIPSVDLRDALKSNYFNALSESVFGFKQIGENKAKNLKCFSLIDSLIGMAVQRIAYPWYRPKFLLNFSPFGRNFLKVQNEYKTFITTVINDMKEHIVSQNKIVDNLFPITDNGDRFSNHLQKSFTYILLRQHFEDPSFTFDDLHDEVSTILITGYDTTSYTTLWCLFLLGLYPEVQEKAFNEIQSLANNYITYEDTCNMVYLEAIIMETLRLYPTVPILARDVSEDVQYGKYKVHKGTTVAFIPYLSHRNPDLYPNPENFEPERFLNAESKTAGSYVPFSVGNRICIGKKYAMIEMKIFIAHILRNYKIISLDNREDIGLCWNIVLLPARQIRLKITPRHSETSS